MTATRDRWTLALILLATMACGGGGDDPPAADASLDASETPDARIDSARRDAAALTPEELCAILCAKAETCAPDQEACPGVCTPDVADCSDEQKAAMAECVDLACDPFFECLYEPGCFSG